MPLIFDDVQITAILDVINPVPQDQIRTAIADQLRNITDIGKVHEFEPFIAHAQMLRQLFGVGVIPYQRIIGWTITRARTQEIRSAQRENDRLYVYMIRGYYGVADNGATELRFQRLVEYVCDTFRDDETDYHLGGIVEWIDPPQVIRIDHVMLVGTLCHYCEISITAHVRVNW